ncbi:thioredoxin family protein [Jeotgalibacillus aurantiacus]|uniref:thioredoxin family protein n=1 Tax=Jeotgalibacillus aurantiacus TaxID=2763266 RepID=UPI001D0ACB84|nr:thioredoxin family protein [Jeotgalibacillus aurantiacus]
MIKEWNIDQLNTHIQTGESTAMYLYTPMCGTCKLAGKMLEVTAAAVKEPVIGKADLNYVESLAEKYEIESVPCLLLFKDGRLQEKIYKFESVPTLFEAFQRLTLQTK